MYNKYKVVLFTVFILLFSGFSVFFAWAFHKQQEDYVKAQCQELLDKQNIIVKQIDAMVKRDGDWKKEKDFYKNFLKDSVEEIDKDKYSNAVLYDENLNLISTRYGETGGDISNPLLIDETICDLRSSENGKGFLYYNNVLKDNKENIKDKIYYCYTWIPSVKGNPRFLIVMVLAPSKLAYSNYIFTYGALTLLFVFAILFLGYVHILKVVNLRSSYKKITNDRRG